jgi:hypothetical protein
MSPSGAQNFEVTTLILETYVHPCIGIQKKTYKQKFSVTSINEKTPDFHLAEKKNSKSVPRSFH